MKLYFGNMVTTVTTLMIVSLVGLVGYSIGNRSNINFWGRRSLIVLAYGLVICCFAAARDGLDKTIQYTIDASLFENSTCSEFPLSESHDTDSFLISSVVILVPTPQLSKCVAVLIEFIPFPAVPG